MSLQPLPQGTPWSVIWFSSFPNKNQLHHGGFPRPPLNMTHTFGLSQVFHATMSLPSSQVVMQPLSLSPIQVDIQLTSICKAHDQLMPYMRLIVQQVTKLRHTFKTKLRNLKGLLSFQNLYETLPWVIAKIETQPSTSKVIEYERTS